MREHRAGKRAQKPFSEGFVREVILHLIIRQHGKRACGIRESGIFFQHALFFTRVGAAGVFSRADVGVFYIAHAHKRKKGAVIGERAV